jgi:hypothetical protein
VVFRVEDQVHKESPSFGHEAILQQIGRHQLQ